MLHVGGPSRFTDTPIRVVCVKAHEGDQSLGSQRPILVQKEDIFDWQSIRVFDDGDADVLLLFREKETLGRGLHFVVDRWVSGGQCAGDVHLGVDGCDVDASALLV